MSEKITSGLRTWIEINQAHLAANYQTWRRLLGADCALMSVCKSNAYGHSLLDFAAAVEKSGVDWLAVDSILEAVKLRQNNLKQPILVLGYTLPKMIKEAAAQNVSLTVSNFEALAALKAVAPDNLKIHLKFDTGMCRQGFFPEETDKVLDYLAANSPAVKIEGVYTHLAAAKNPAFPADTRQQLAAFDKVLVAVAKRGLKPLRHAAASSGAIVFPESRFDLVRVGIGLYGLWPSLEVQYAFGDKLNLEPILSWKTVVGEIKKVPAGSRVGYDFTDRLERDSVIGVLPVGYWHGYDRSLSSIGRVLVNGCRARILGRVSMDMLTVDLTGIPDIKVGDEVVLIGRQGQELMSADEMAMLVATSPYEALTRLNPLIKRVYI